MSELNVEKIMEEIRNEIKEKGYTNDILSFNDIIADDAGVDAGQFEREKFNEELFTLNLIWNIDPNRVIERRSGLKGKCVTLFKKFVRKCIRFYLSLIVMEQNTFNATAVRLFNMLNQYMDENERLLDEVSSLKDKQEMLEKKVDQLYNLHYKEG